MRKLDLSNVTAVCIDGRPLTQEKRLRYSQIIKYMRSTVNFAEIKLLMLDDPEVDGTSYVKVNQIDSLEEYSQFCLTELSDHIDTDFCMIFQDDGFIVNPELWRPVFLSYDYIGAPWPPVQPWPEPDRYDRRVGNGGFSIRSKRLLEATKNFEASDNEDIIIVSAKRDELDSQGFTFAPVEIAMDFSIETQFLQEQAMSKCFGFHGKYRVEEALRIISKKSEIFSTSLV